jgi:hypothetical protein
MSTGRWTKRGRTFQGRAKSVWALAGASVTVATDYVTTRLTLRGASSQRLVMTGTDKTQVTLIGTSAERITMLGASPQ